MGICGSKQNHYKRAKGTFNDADYQPIKNESFAVNPKSPDG